jgi:hypothetical protein
VEKHVRYVDKYELPVEKKWMHFEARWTNIGLIVEITLGAG